MSRSISSALTRTARLLDLVPYVTTHQGIAVAELAQHFGVTPAQMIADLTTLWMCGLPGYTPLELMELEFESGYVTINNAPTLAKPRDITFQEGVALLLGLDLLASSLPPDRVDLINLAISLRQRLALIVAVPIQLSAAPVASPMVAAAITTAISARSGLTIEYHSLYKDLITERVITPIEIYELDNHQYLHAFCFNASDYREFRVDRIAQARAASTSADFVAETHNEEKIGFSITANGVARDVAERFTLPDLLAGSTYKLSSYSRQWIERSVLASGAAITLNSPSEIRTEIAQKAQSMLNRYKEG